VEEDKKSKSYNVLLSDYNLQQEKLGGTG